MTMMQTRLPEIDRVVRHAMQTPVFSAIPEETLSGFLSENTPVELAPGQNLFQQLDPARHFWFIDSGTIKLHICASDGNDKVVEVIHEGQTFAEAIMFMERNRYPVTATAMEATRVYAVENQRFRDYLAGHPECCMTMLGRLSQRLHVRLGDVTRLSLKHADHRVASWLLTRIPETTENHYTVELDMPKTVLASRLSILPETLSRALHKLSDQELIRNGDRIIDVLDVAGLERLVHH